MSVSSGDHHLFLYYFCVVVVGVIFQITPVLGVEIHHTCRSCKTHFNHLDGDTYDRCEKCNYNNK